MYIHELNNWTEFNWNHEAIAPLLARAHYCQGRIMGTMENIGFPIEREMESDVLTSEVLASSQIEGVELDATKVHSSVCKQLGIESQDSTPDTHDVDGAVSVMMDATQNANDRLTKARLYGWHNALFPTGYSGLHKIHVAQFRKSPISVVSGPFGHERKHFEAPSADAVPGLMNEFIRWFNADNSQDPLLKAGAAHLWFLTIHPFEDGNGRLARAITEMLLARADNSSKRFYSMARYILEHREEYYSELETAQKGTSDITDWIMWFLKALIGSIEQSENTIRKVLERENFWQSLSGVALNDRQRDMLLRLKGDFQGNLTTKKWAKIEKVSDDTALRDINDLIDKGILAKAEKGGRSTTYVLANRT